jgi:hypothetical protein
LFAFSNPSSRSQLTIAGPWSWSWITENRRTARPSGGHDERPDPAALSARLHRIAAGFLGFCRERSISTLGEALQGIALIDAGRQQEEPKPRAPLAGLDHARKKLPAEKSSSHRPSEALVEHITMDSLFDLAGPAERQAGLFGAM